VFRTVGWGLVPGLLPLRMRQQGRAGPVDGLMQIRYLMLSFVGAILLIGLMVGFDLLGTGEAPQPSSGPPGAWIIVTVVGVAGLAFASRYRRRLDCSGDAALAGGYRNVFFVRLAAAEVPALTGFVAYMTTDVRWLFFVPMAFTLVGSALVAPGVGNLAREQDRLRLQGCARSLVAALRQPRD